MCYTSSIFLFHVLFSSMFINQTYGIFEAINLRVNFSCHVRLVQPILPEFVPEMIHEQ